MSSPRIARMPSPIRPARPALHDAFGEVDLESDEPAGPASRCSYPPPNVTLELEIDPELMATLRATAPQDDETSFRDTQPEHTRPTAPTRTSDPHSIEEALVRAADAVPPPPAAPASIEEAVLRLIESRPRLVPKA